MTAVPCTPTTVPIDCYYNTTCTWDFRTDTCVRNAPSCASRTPSREDCHRDGQCFWTGTTCVTRSIPADRVTVDTLCGQLLILSDLVASGDNCNSQETCEYDLYTGRCIADRMLTCAQWQTELECKTTAGCWWTNDGACRALARDYMAVCADFDRDPEACNALHSSCAFDWLTNRCDPLPKAQMYPYYPLMQFCRLDIRQPFLQYCNATNPCSVDCVVKDSRCAVTLSATALDICQPSAPYVCAWVQEQDSCLEYSFCEWRNTTCVDPNAPIPPVVVTTPRGSLASGDATSWALIAVLLLIMAVFLVSVVVYVVLELRRKKPVSSKLETTHPLLSSFSSSSSSQSTDLLHTLLGHLMHPAAAKPHPVHSLRGGYPGAGFSV